MYKSLETLRGEEKESKAKEELYKNYLENIIASSFKQKLMTKKSVPSLFYLCLSAHTNFFFFFFFFFLTENTKNLKRLDLSNTRFLSFSFLPALVSKINFSISSLFICLSVYLVKCLPIG